MNVLCVIPARGGSKGIPDKNLRIVGGHPLVWWSVHQALNTGMPTSSIVVSSDSEDILDIARNERVVALKRPDNISGDDSKTEDAMLHALEWYEPEYSPVSAVLLLQPTSPIRFSGRVQQCIEKFTDGDYESLVTVTKFYDLFWHRRHGSWVTSYVPRCRCMRQDMDRADFSYFENGNIYITRPDVLRETSCRIGRQNRTCVVSITEVEGMQIDTEDDLDIISTILSTNLIYKYSKAVNDESQQSNTSSRDRCCPSR